MNIKPLFDTIIVKMKSHHFWLRVGGATFLTLLIFYALFYFIEPEEVVAILSKVSLRAIAIGFVFYFGSTLFRAARFHVVHRTISTRVFFSIASIHTLLTNLLPVRAGELTFPLLVKRVDGSPIMSSFSMLFIVRIFDLIAVFLLFFVAIAMTYTRLDVRLHVPMLLVSLSFVAGLAVLLCVLVFGKRALRVAHSILFFDGLRQNRVTRWIFSKLELLVKGFSVIRQRHAVLRIMLFSLLIWVCNYATVFVIVRSMGLDLSVWVLVLGFTFSTLFSSLPIHGLGSFGTLEGAWTLIFLSFGAAKEVSFATGFGFHVFNIAYLTLLAIVGTVHLMFLPKKEHA